MRKWLETLLDTQYLPAVQPLEATQVAEAEHWAAWMRGKWAERGFTSLTQQKNLMLEVRRELKQRLGEHHIALDTLNFSTEEWTEANRQTTQRVALQNANQQILSPATVNAIVTRATNLLLSREWSDVAAGLAVLTGRRSAEILKTAVFSLKTTYSVVFTGALKRQGESVQLRFEIPTLCAASDVIRAWEKLRQIVPTEDLSLTQVNIRLSPAVAEACDRHFADLVPPIEGRDNLYTHLFRKIYATIATYFYCPPTVDEAEFRAEIQGHFTAQEGQTLAERRSLNSDRFYRSYVILDAEGNSRKGIRLDWHGVEVLEAFRPATQVQGEIQEMADSTPTLAEAKAPKRDRTTLGIWHDDRNRWKVILEAIAPDANRQEEKTAALLEWIEQRLHADQVEIVEEEVLAPPPAPELSVVADQAKAIAWFTQEVERLRQAQPAESDTAEWAERIAELEAENAKLKAERDLAVSKLNQFRTLLNGGSAAEVIPEAEPQAEIPPESGERGSNNPPSNIPPESGERRSRSHQSNVSTESGERRSRSHPEDLDPDVLRALNAIMEYNNSREFHQDKWAISYPVMKDLLKQVGSATQPKIKAVFEAKAQEIEAHHQAHGLGERHNRKHQGQSITEFIRF